MPELKAAEGSQIRETKRLLDRELKESTVKPFVEVIPILHNHNRVFLQLCGWAIVLREDGSWFWEATDGG